METLSGPVLSFSGSKILPNGAVYSKMPFRFHRRDTNRFSKFHFQTAVASRRLTQNQSFQMLYLHNRSSATTHISSAGRNYELNYDDDSRTKPFWLNMIQEAIWYYITQNGVESNIVNSKNDISRELLNVYGV
ncbi:hypothetical protein ACS0TY_006557 [Phlomoides rotata]